MTNAEINIFFQTVAILAALLLLGTFLRAKVKLFQTLFLPACVIGGVIGLILGPRVLGLLPISEEIMTTASNLPGRLFGVIIAAQLAWPELNMGIPWLSFGRLRPLHTNAVIFAFGGCALMATSYYVVQRTCQVRLFSDFLAAFNCQGGQGPPV